MTKSPNSRAASGRNQACPCGSGRKFKHCCGTKGGRLTLSVRLALVAAAGLLIAGIAAGVSSLTSEDAGAPRGVWSPEHGHYH
jgi:hypothetical protein